MSQQKFEVSLITFYGLPEAHHSIFIRTDRNGSGYVFHVVGGMHDEGGMTFETMKIPDPNSSHDFLSRTWKGRTDLSKLREFEQVCRSIPAPAQQYTDGAKIDPNTLERHCQHWAREALAALKARGVIYD